MPSRRDQIQSYQFFMQRVISAFVARNPDPTMTPFRRLGGAGLGSFMIAILFLAAVGAYGLIFPGGATSWKDGSTIIMEKETGALYIYRDGELHPVANYSSALLAMGSAVSTTKVSSNSLLGVPRGTTIGIENAPDSLPDADRILDDPWSLCTKPAKDEAGQLVATTILTVGQTPDGDQPSAEEGILARDPQSDTLYLIWNNHRFEIKSDSERIVLEALALATASQAMVGDAWLNALPAGQPIGTIAVSDIGKSSEALSGAANGQVYVVANESGIKQYYLVDSTTLIPITELQANIVLADSATKSAYAGDVPEALPLDAATAANSPKESVSADDTQVPATTPTILTLAGDQPAICATYSSGNSAPEILVNATVSGVSEPVETVGTTDEGTPLADKIIIEPGYGVLVTSMPSSDSPGGTTNLVTDLGYRYPLATDDIPAILGYSDVTPIELPGSLVVRIPSGPALDTTAASQALDQ